MNINEKLKNLWNYPSRQNPALYSIMGFPFPSFSNPVLNRNIFDLTGLKAYYKFNESSGNIINNANEVGSASEIPTSDLAVTGMTYVSSGGDSPFGFQGSFDGTDDDTQASSTSASDWAFLNQTGANWTIIFWVKCDDFGQSHVIFSTTNFNIGDTGFLVNIQTDRTIRLICGRDGTDRILFTTTAIYPNDANWHMVMMQYDDASGTASISVDDGTPEDDTGNNLTNTTNPETHMWIGENMDSGSRLKGDLAEISIWDRILSDTEITDLYNSGSGKEL